MSLRLHAAWVLLLTFLFAAPAANAAEDPFVHPPELEKDIRFWIRVYTEVTTEGGLIHDDWDLGLVYEVLRFDPADSQRERERLVEKAKARYTELLKRFAAGNTENLTAHEKRILQAFGEKPAPQAFRDAIDRLRFQLGQADRFHEGLIRAQQYERAISKVLSQHGVPPEIGALPHVESSFNIAAYSRVGAAGLWQFMPSTARRYMRVDGIVDQRLDPYSATEAAANLMLYNYHLLGSWPLAVTAYNHGPGGLKTAQDELGTDDIAVIVKRYNGRTFGFASRNFYVAFLAALEVDRNAEKFFGATTHLTDTQSTVVEVPDYIPVQALEKAFKVDNGALKVLNPALRPPIWSGARFVPRGYGLRLPGTLEAHDIEEALGRLPGAQRYLAQRNDGSHKMRRGETLAGVAAASGVPLSRLLALNNLAPGHEAARGEVVRIPMPATRGAPASGPAEAAEAPPATAATPQVVQETPVAAEPSKPPREPVSQRQAQSAALLPALSPATPTDAADYEVHDNDTVIVQPGETLGHFADWTHSSAATLRNLNKLHKSAMVTLGHKMRLDFSRVSPADFTAARRAYHTEEQDSFFASHRIAGTDSYVVKRGESLWTIAQRNGELPVWLVSEYNPEVRFGEVRPGTTITLPKIAPINRQ